MSSSSSSRVRDDQLTRHIMSRLLHFEGLEDRIVELEVKNGQLEEIVLELRDKVQKLTPHDDDDDEGSQLVDSDPEPFKLHKDLTISVVSKDRADDGNGNGENQMEIMDILQTEIEEHEPGDDDVHDDDHDPSNTNIIIKSELTRNPGFVDERSQSQSHGLSDNEISISTKNSNEKAGPSSKMRIKTESNYDEPPSNNNTSSEAEADVNPDGSSVDKPFKCTWCPKSFLKIQNLNRHSFNHTGFPKLPYGYYACTQCPMKFSTASLLKKHVLIHIQIQVKKPYKCQSCPKSFGRNCHLTQHVKDFHSTANAGHEPSLECHICSKGFRMRRLLKHHLLKHSGKKLFECRLCNKTYTDQSALSRHNRIHNGTNLHTCTYCGRVFTRKDNHDGHVKTHFKSGRPIYPTF